MKRMISSLMMALSAGTAHAQRADSRHLDVVANSHGEQTGAPSALVPVVLGHGVLDPGAIAATIELTPLSCVQAQASLTWIGESARVFVVVDNVFNSVWHEVDLEPATHPRSDAKPVRPLQFTSGSPRAIQFGIELSF